MRKILSLLLFLFVCLIWPVCAAERNQPVKTGIFAFDGYHESDKEGNLHGYGIDFLNLASRYSHLNFDLKGFAKSWNDMLEMLKNGEIDLVTSARRTPAREEIFAFSIPIGKNMTILSAKSDNMKLRVGDYQNWDGIKIGILKGSTQNAILEKFANNKGFKYLPVEFDDAHKLADALQASLVDAILTSNLRKAKNEKPLDSLDSSNFYAITRKEDQQLIDELNYAIEQMDLNEGDWRNELFYKNYGPVAPAARPFTSRENTYIEAARQNDKTLKIRTAADRPPYSYVEDGELKGIIPEYFEIVMERTGLPYTFLPYDNEDSLEPADTDIIADSPGPAITSIEDNAPGFDSPVYMSTGIAQVMKAGYHGPLNKIALTRVQLTPELRSRLPREADYLYYPTQIDAMEAVADGKANAAYVDGYAAQNFVNQNPDNGLIYNMLNDLSVDFRMHVPSYADHELSTIIDKSMHVVPEGTINQLILKYTSPALGDLSFLQYMKKNPVTSFLIVLAAAILATLTFGLYINSKANKKLLVATEKSKNDLAEQLAIVEALSRDYTDVFTINGEKGYLRPVKYSGSLPEPNKDGSALWSYAALIKKYISGCVYPDDREGLAADLALERVKEELQAHPAYTGTYRMATPEGEILYYQYFFMKFNDKGDSSILAGFRDINEMIKKEKDQKEALSDALEKANSANRAKTKFLNNMSHDIRTPMNAIIGFTSLASTYLANTDLVKSYLAKIMTSGNHLLSLINDVLDMSRIESGKVELDEKEASLPEVVADLKTIIQSDIKSKSITFTIKTINILNETIICDKLRLNQVLINILNNALKYTMSGGEVELQLIQASAAQSGYADYEFRIKDTGIGMDKAFLERVFEPFEREQTSTVSGIQGTGLGLAITKNIVTMMGGSIHVESETGKGSEFFVNFRFRVAPVPELQPIPALKGQKCLIATNDDALLSNLVRMLEALGIEADWSAESNEIIAMAREAAARHLPYNLYLVDWQIGDTSGIELTRQIKQVIGGSDTPILMCVYDWLDIEDEAHAAGVTAFLPKPVFLSELRSLLDPQKLTASGATGNEQQVFEGRRALLVDDNEFNLEIGQMVLENIGLEVETAEDGTEAVEKVKAAPVGEWDIILMDVQMPKMDGYEATRLIRGLADPLKAAIPIVAMTANAFEEDRKEAMEAGMNGYVAKPIDMKQLLAVLQAVLGKSPDEARN